MSSGGRTGGVAGDAAQRPGGGLLDGGIKLIQADHKGVHRARVHHGLGQLWAVFGHRPQDKGGSLLIESRARPSAVTASSIWSRLGRAIAAGGGRPVLLCQAVDQLGEDVIGDNRGRKFIAVAGQTAQRQGGALSSAQPPLEFADGEGVGVGERGDPGVRPRAAKGVPAGWWGRCQSGGAAAAA